MGSFARAVRVVAPGAAVGGRAARQTRLVGALAVTERAGSLSAEEEHAARALWEHDAANRGATAEEDALRRIPRPVPGTDGRMLLRVVHERPGGHAPHAAEPGRIERERRRAERRSADDRDAAVARQGRSAQEAAPLVRNLAHEPGNHAGADVADPVETLGPAAREARGGPRPVRDGLGAGRVVVHVHRSVEPAAVDELAADLVAGSARPVRSAGR